MPYEDDGSREDLDTMTLEETPLTACADDLVVSTTPRLLRVCNVRRAALEKRRYAPNSSLVSLGQSLKKWGPEI